MNNAGIAVWVVAVAIVAIVMALMGSVLIGTSAEELREAEEDTATPEQKPFIEPPVAGAMITLTAGVILLMKALGEPSVTDPTCTQCDSGGYPTTYKSDKTIQCEECDTILFREL